MSYFFEIAAGTSSTTVNLDEIAAMALCERTDSLKILLKSGEALPGIHRGGENYRKIMAKIKNLNGES